MPGGRKMSLSIGVACLPDDAADPEGLLTAAEAALRGAKRGGPGRVQYFSAGDGTPVQGARRRGRSQAAEIDRFRPYQERMHEVTTILMRDRALSCLLVDLSRLHKVELDSACSITARSTITAPRCSIACAARSSIRPTSCAAPATVTATS